MKLFDKKYMYLEWDDVLKGKEVFLAYTLPELRRNVEMNKADFRHFIKKNSDDYPFITANEEICYSFAYYDPNYSCKRAYVHGKQIQYKSKGSLEPWIDCFKEPFWTEVCEYRVKPEPECISCQYQYTPNSCVTCTEHSNYNPRVIHKKRRMTNRELSKWLAHGSGECRDEEGMVIDIQYRYCVNREDYPCDDGTLIRGWDETEWHVPETEEVEK